MRMRKRTNVGLEVCAPYMVCGFTRIRHVMGGCLKLYLW